DKVTKQFYGKPFHQTVKSMRMWHAKALMVYKRNLTEISKLCGYTDYSAFYRAYSSFFGVSPKKEYQFYLKNKTFLSDKNNDTITSVN
ncbi:MAG: helix-turn-helix transcriptional regulator, partial [Clostridia bacterium]|nr:helix-turn-helix transcriptional regulator [Clostridia bacterium]